MVQSHLHSQQVRGATQGTRGTTQGTRGTPQGTRGATQGTRVRCRSMYVKAVALAGRDLMMTGAAACVRVDRPIYAPPRTSLRIGEPGECSASRPQRFLSASGRQPKKHSGLILEASQPACAGSRDGLGTGNIAEYTSTPLHIGER